MANAMATKIEKLTKLCFNSFGHENIQYHISQITAHIPFMDKS